MCCMIWWRAKIKGIVVLMRYSNSRLMLCTALFISLALMAIAVALPDEAVGHVVSVVSGDSLGVEMLLADNRTNSIDSIRLADIKAPSTVTPEGKVAWQYAVALLKNKTVYLDIEDDPAIARSIWGQLSCVVYLMDSESRPLWPPVNRMMVDAGYAVINDDPKNEFNSSEWYLASAPFSTMKVRERFLERVEAAIQSAQSQEQSQSSAPSGTNGTASAPVSQSITTTGMGANSGGREQPAESGSESENEGVSGTNSGEPKKSSVLEKDSRTGGYSIGYRK